MNGTWRNGRRILPSAALLLLLAPFAAMAAEPDAETRARLSKQVSKVFPELQLTSIRATPMAGLYELQLGTELLYMSEDGRFVLRGDLIDLQGRANLSEARRGELRAERLRNIPPQDLIEFSPPHPRHFIYVFTDVNCGYCRRLHREVPELNRRGIGVRYLAFPVIGDAEKTRRIMESIWCAQDRREALTLAKSGRAVESRRCDNPVSRHLEIGRGFGVRGTPAIYLQNGQELPGYLSPPELERYLQGS